MGSFFQGPRLETAAYRRQSRQEPDVCRCFMLRVFDNQFGRVTGRTVAIVTKFCRVLRVFLPKPTALTVFGGLFLGEGLEARSLNATSTSLAFNKWASRCSVLWR